jgi:aldose 1-epimerase
MRRAPDAPIGTGQAASFLMAPWTNRVRDARFRFGGLEHPLRSNFPDGTAIHGVVRDAPWRVTDRTPVSARMVYDSRSDESVNFPFAFASVFRVELSPDALTLELSVTNLDDRPMPAGCGHHPYFPRTLMASGEQLELSAGVRGRYAMEKCLPVGPAADDEICAALRRGGPLGNPGLDDVFAGFDGSAVITWPGSRVRLMMECSEEFEHLVVFTPRLDPTNASSPPLPWLCVEPCTMLNDGFNIMAGNGLETGVRVLEPGETLDTRVRWRVERF